MMEERVKLTDDKTMCLDLDKLIARCFDECEQVGYLLKSGTKRVIVNQEELVKHIQKTIIGELFELEICRRLAPIFREAERLSRDFSYLEARDAQEKMMLSMRIGQADSGSDR